MDSFKNLYQEKIEEKEHKIFCEFVEMLEKNDLLEESVLLDEGFFSNILDKVKNVLKSIPAQLKEKFNFIKDLAINLKLSLIDLLKTFKDKFVFKFFTLMKWSLKNFFVKLKKGFDSYTHLTKIIAEFINKEGRISKWTDAHVKKLSDFIHSHPAIAWASGFLLACLVLYIWMITVSTGNILHDFDLSNVIQSLTKNLTFYDVFGGTNGVEIIVSILTGTVMNLSFPWASIIGSAGQLSELTATVAVVVSGFIVTFGKQAGVKIKEKVKYKKEDEEEMDKILADT